MGILLEQDDVQDKISDSQSEDQKFPGAQSKLFLDLGFNRSIFTGRADLLGPLRGIGKLQFYKQNLADIEDYIWDHPTVNPSI
jgi:hypothetical protein